MAASASTPEDGPGYVDTHCHLDEILTQLKVFPPYDRAITDRDALFGPGCEALVAQFCDPAAFSPSFAVYPDLLKIPGVHAAFGIHPHHARFWNDDLAARVLDALRHERAVAYGEIGLDFKVNRSPPEAQRECFRSQLRLALSLDPPLPVVLHCARAEDEMLAMLLEAVPAERRETFSAHLHCFTGNATQAAAFLSAFPSLCIGVTGFVTYRSASGLQSALRDGAIPLSRLLLETDGPHMAPDTPDAADSGSARAEPGAREAGAAGRGGGPAGERPGPGRGRGRGGGGQRGGRRGKGGRRGGRRKTNTPASIPAIAAAVGSLLGCGPEAVLAAARENTRRVYGV